MSTLIWFLACAVVFGFCVYNVYRDQERVRRENALRWPQSRPEPLWPEDFVLRNGKAVLREPDMWQV
jgi:hypothetical protein